MLRLFFGIQLFHDSYLSSVQDMLKLNLSGDGIKWVAESNFHVTLKFLGNVEEYYVNALEIIMVKLASQFSSFEVEFGSPGMFLNKKGPSIIWLGLKQNSSVVELHKNISSSLVELGFKANTGKFTPHVTLARVKRTAQNIDEKKLNEINHGNKGYCVMVNHLQLMQSKLNPQGTKYSVLKEVVLTG